MGDIFDQVASGESGDIFDQVSSSPKYTPRYTKGDARDIFDRIEESLGEAYNSALGKANEFNQAISYPSEKIYEQLTHPSPGVDISNQPGVKTVSGIVSGAADPRNIPFFMLGQPEVGSAVKAAAGATLAGVQGEQAIGNVEQGQYGQAIINGALAGGAFGALHEGVGALPGKESVNELPRMAEEANSEVPQEPQAVAQPTPPGDIFDRIAPQSASEKGLDLSSSHPKGVSQPVPAEPSVSASTKSGANQSYPRSTQITSKNWIRQQNVLEAWLDQRGIPYERGNGYIHVTIPDRELARDPNGLIYDDLFTVRIADHQQARGGGYNVATGERYGEANLSIDPSTKLTVKDAAKAIEDKLQGMKYDPRTHNWTNSSGLPVDVQGREISPGPGGRTAGETGDINPYSGLGGLNKSIQELIPNQQQQLPADLRVQEEESIAPKDPVIAGAIANARAKMTALWQSVKQWQEGRPQVGGIEGAAARMSKIREMSKVDADQFASTMRKAVPSDLVREGMANWMEAGGDEALLRDRAEHAVPKYKPGYEAALHLTDEQKTLARNVANWFEERRQLGQSVGMLGEGREDYLNHIYESGPDGKKLRGPNSGILNQNFSFAKRRTFDTFYQAEKAGYKPLTKDIADLIPIYDESYSHAFAARNFMREVSPMLGSDKRPIFLRSGGGSTVEAGAPEEVEPTLMGNKLKRVEQKPFPILANPDLVPHGAEGYENINSPALKGYSFAATAPDGTPVLVKGDLLVHPEFADKFKSLLEPSYFDTHNDAVSKFARPYLRIGSNVKSAMLSLLPNPFHVINEGRMAVANRINPVNLPDIDTSKPEVHKLFEGGLTVGSKSARIGLAPTEPWIFKIPKYGDVLRSFNDWMFGPNGFIAKAKVKGGLEVAQRLMQRHPELSEAEVYARAAKDMNQAFGGQNNLIAFRSKTTQDVLRGLMLAPDFELGRLGYNLGALQKYGSETRRALAFDLATQYAAARVLNTIISGNPHVDKPFSVVAGGKEYEVRGNINDDLAMIKNAHDVAAGVGKPSWFTYRENPLLTGAQEFFTGHDLYGRPLTGAKRVASLVERAVPIAAQGPLAGYDRTLAESVGTASGVHDRIYRSPAASILHEGAMLTIPQSVFMGNSPMSKAVQAVRQGRPWVVHKMVASGKLSQADSAKAFVEGKISQIKLDATRAPLTFLIKAYYEATPQERVLLKPKLLHRASLAYVKETPEEAQKLREQVKEAIASLPRGAIGKALTGWLH